MRGSLSSRVATNLICRTWFEPVHSRKSNRATNSGRNHTIQDFNAAGQNCFHLNDEGLNDGDLHACSHGEETGSNGYSLTGAPKIKRADRGGRFTWPMMVPAFFIAVQTPNATAFI